MKKKLNKAVDIISTFPLNKEGFTVYKGILKVLFHYEATK